MTRPRLMCAIDPPLRCHYLAMAAYQQEETYLPAPFARAVRAMSDTTPTARKKHAAPGNPNRNERETNPATLCVYWPGNLCQVNYVFSNEALNR